MKRRMRAGSLCLFSVLLATGGLYAQGVEATLKGRVQDSSGAAVPAAKLDVKNTGTNRIVSTVSDSAGQYNVPFLQPGTYILTIEAPGFKKVVREGLSLSVGDTVGMDITLEVGAVTEQLTVTAEAPLLETAKADRGTLVDQQTVAEMPLNGRNPFMLAKIAAGVNFNGTVIYQRPFDNGAIAQWTINGGLYESNEFLLDGAPNNAQAGVNNIAYVPPVDAVQEFKIQTNSYDAQYGHTSGGIVNVSLKSGTNAVHGTVYEFARRKAWDANSFQNNAAGAPKGEHYLDQYGGQISGPVYIPKIYDGRNKTFFMFDYEKYRENTPRPFTLSVPAPEFANGDFSKLVNGAGQPIAIYDPATGKDVNGTWTRQVFPNNIIPANRINPIAQKIISYFPKPEHHNSRPGLFPGEPILRRADKDSFYNQVLKFDQQVGSKHHFSIREIRSNRLEMGWDGSNSVTGVGQSGSLPEVRTNDGIEFRVGRHRLPADGDQCPCLLQPVSGGGPRRCQRRIRSRRNWVSPPPCVRPSRRRLFRQTIISLTISPSDSTPPETSRTRGRSLASLNWNIGQSFHQGGRRSARYSVCYAKLQHGPQPERRHRLDPAELRPIRSAQRQ